MKTAMLVRELLECKNLIHLNESTLDNEINGIFSCDLLSHVMGHADEGNIFITVLNNINVLGVASLLDLSCVIFTHNIQVNESVITKANELNIPLFSTSSSTAEIIRTLHKLGV